MTDGALNAYHSIKAGTNFVFFCPDSTQLADEYHVLVSELDYINASDFTKAKAY